MTSRGAHDCEKLFVFNQTLKQNHFFSQAKFLDAKCYKTLIVFEPGKS